MRNIKLLYNRVELLMNVLLKPTRCGLFAVKCMVEWVDMNPLQIIEKGKKNANTTYRTIYNLSTWSLP
jgi:hypothetical protein